MDASIKVSTIVSAPLEPTIEEMVNAGAVCTLQLFNSTAIGAVDMCGEVSFQRINTHTFRIIQDIDPTKINIP